MNEPILIMIMGPQASGKTTLVNKILANNPGIEEFIYVSPDKFWPIENGVRYWRDHSGNVKKWDVDNIPIDILRQAYRWALNIFKEAIDKRENIILEDIFMTTSSRYEFLQYVINKGYRIEGIVLMPEFGACVYRNTNRGNGVPREILSKTYDKYEVPTKNEGFTNLIIYTDTGLPEGLRL